jgi:hypothetical protein
MFPVRFLMMRRNDDHTPVAQGDRSVVQTFRSAAKLKRSPVMPEKSGLPSTLRGAGIV